MADLPLQSIVADFKIHDLATKDLIALQKVVNKAVKDLTTLEKEAAKAESVLGKLGKSAKGTASGVAGAAGAVVQKPIGIAESTISGGMVGAIAAIPVLGGLMSALSGTLTDVANKYESGIALQKILNRDLSTIDRTFNRTGINIIKGLDQTFSTLTEQRQFASTLVGAGAEASTVAKANPQLEALAKAQGIDLKDVTTTRLEVGKGLTKAEIALLDATRSQFSSIWTANHALQVWSNVIEKASKRKEFQESIEQNKNLQKVAIKTEDGHITYTKSIQEASVEISKSKQSLSLMAVENNNYVTSMKAFTMEIDKQRFNFEKITSKVASGSISVVEGVEKVLGSETSKRSSAEQAAKIKQKLPGQIWSNKENDWVYPGKALGGSVDRGHTYRINEKGQEFFTPGQSGTIHPANQNNSQSVTLAPVINIYGGDSGEIRRVVNEELNNLARKIAYNQGLKIPG